MKIPALARVLDVQGPVLDGLLARYDGMLKLVVEHRHALGQEFRFRYFNDLDLLFDVQVINRLYRFRSMLDKADMHVFAEHSYIVFMSRLTYRARHQKIPH